MDQDASATAMERLRSMLNVPPANRPPDWINPLEKIEQLLTCSICLDRYKNPKLLPCQHTFCTDPCLTGLVDNIRRLVKCPECRAEHPLPYEGLKAFQTNYSLMGFLEIHLQATEENASELEAYIRRYNLERCKSCDEKAVVDQCNHCDKKICSNCKVAHMDMLKKDLGRLMNQVKRVANRINDSTEILTRNVDNVKMNCDLVKDEVRDYVKRFTKELKKREDALITEIEAFQLAETRLATTTRENLELEGNSINESCDKVESCLKGESELTDEELVKFKQIFTEGLDHLRTVNIDADDICNKKIRFFIGPDPHLLPHAIGQFGELQVCTPQFSQKLQAVDQVFVPRFTHISSVGEVDRRNPVVKKRFWGDAPADTWAPTVGSNSHHHHQQQQQLRDETSSSSRKVPPIAGVSEDGYSSRFRRRQLLEEQAWNRLKAETNVGGSSSSAHSPSRHLHVDNDPPGNSGYVSSVGTNARSSETSLNVRSTSPRSPPETSCNIAPRHAVHCPPQIEAPKTRPRTLSQQIYHEPTVESAHREQQHSSRGFNDTHNNNNNNKHAREFENKPQSSRTWSNARTELVPSNNTTTSPPSTSPSPAPKRRIQRQETEDEELNQRIETIRKDWEEKQRLDKEKLQNIAKKFSDQSLRSKTCELPVLRGDAEESETIETNETEVIQPVPVVVYRSIPVHQERPRSAEFEAPSVGEWKKYLIPENSTDGEVGTSSTTEGTSERNGPAEQTQNRFVRSRTNPDFLVDSAETTEQTETVENADTPNTPNRPERHNRFKRKAERSHTSQTNGRPKFTVGGGDESGTENTGTRLEVSLPETHGGPGSRFYRVFATPNIDYLQKGACLLKYGSKGSGENQFNWPRGIALTRTTGDLLICDSSNHRLMVYDKTGAFVKTIGGYGSGPGEFDSLAGVCVNKFDQIIVSDRYNHRIQVFDANGRFLREFGTHGQTNGRFNNPWGVATDSQGFIYVCDKDNHRIQIFQADGNYVGKFGVNGSKDGQFQNPHFITINRQNQLLITDCCNHRVQVFDHNGTFLFAFGLEGMHEGQFKYPRGIAVDEQGFVAVADSGNHRIQVFYPDGRFLTRFASWGSTDGQLKGVEGVIVDDDGRVIVSDRENHRIQMF